MHQVDVGYPFATVFLIVVVGQSVMLKAATLVSHRGVSCSKSLSSDVQSNQSLQHWQLSGSTPNNVPIKTVPRFEPEYSI